MPEDTTEAASGGAAARAARQGRANNRGSGPAISLPAGAARAELFEGIIGIASDAIISIDESQTIVLYNNGAEQLFGWRAQEVIGRSLDLLIPPRFRAAHAQHVRGFGDSPVPARRMGERREIVGLRKNGEEFPADASISKIDVDGQRLYTVVLRDVTDRKRREQGQAFLAEAGALLAGSLDMETTLRKITELAVRFFADLCVIFRRTPEGGLTRIDAAHADPALDALLESLRLDRIEPGSSHPAHAVVETGDTIVVEDVADGSHGSGIPEPERRLMRSLSVRSAVFAPLRAHNEVQGVIGFYLGDGGETYTADSMPLANELAMRASLAMHNAKLYEDARQAIQARDDVLAVVSHDLGNPLAAIRIGTGLLLKMLPAGSEAAGGWKHVENIRQSVQHMERLINDLLNVKRVEAGQLGLEWARIAPASLIEEAIKTMMPLAEEKAISLTSKCSLSLPHVHADRHRVMQVFSNLVGNAIKFTPDRGQVGLAAALVDGQVVFSISDSGPGIDSDDLDHVFDRFWQAHRRKREGIGLGLAIVDSIIRAHGGRVWVESERGVGATFHFVLPTASGDADDP